MKDKKLTFAYVLAFAIPLIVLSIGRLKADSGWENATRIERGSYPSPTQFTVTTAANVLIADVDTKRPDLTCRNYSAYTLFIGTNTAGTTMTSTGFPVLANEPFQLDAYTGQVYALASGGSVDVRCWTGKVQ